MAENKVDKIIQGTPIEIGGKIRYLLADMWALATIENEAKENLINGQYFQDVTLNKLITLVWGFLQEDEEVSLETKRRGSSQGRKLVASWINFGDFEFIFSKVMEEFNRVSAKVKEGKAQGKEETKAEVKEALQVVEENGNGQST